MNNDIGTTQLALTDFDNNILAGTGPLVVTTESLWLQLVATFTPEQRSIIQASQLAAFRAYTVFIDTTPITPSHAE